MRPSTPHPRSRPRAATSIQTCELACEQEPPADNRLWLRLALLIAVLAALLFLWVPRASPAEPDTREALAIGDKITVSVFGQSDLSGDFVLDGGGMVQMPLIGRVRIAGMTPQEAENRIRDGLLDGYLREAVVSVRISELRPVYVMGEVRSPGSYPFRHGLKVLGAVALAGGYRVGETSASVLKSELLLAEERMRLLDTSLQVLTARRMRLEAERDGRKSVPVSSATAGPGMAQMIAGEQEILDFLRRAHEGERDLLAQQIARLESEKGALTEQAELADRQVTLTKENASEYTKLAATGHGLRTVQVEREREYVRTRSELSRIKADLAKNETALGELTLRLRDADTAFMRRVVVELQDTRQKILEVERSMPTAREIYESRRRRLIAGEGTATAADWDIKIMRQVGMEQKTIQAQFETALQPGDVVQIIPRTQASDAGDLPGASATTLGALSSPERVQ